jgi:Calcium-activated chloride channel
MFQYNNYHDYSSIIVQFCFVLFFACVFPLAPLIALINNTLLLRLSAYKVCYTRQRPIALKSAGLGVWEDVLQVMSVLGILTNCGIMGYTSSVLRTRLTPIIGTAGLVVALFALEHSILLLKYWLSAAVPRVPIGVQRAQARDRRSLGRRKQVRRIYLFSLSVYLFVCLSFSLCLRVSVSVYVCRYGVAVDCSQKI